MNKLYKLLLICLLILSGGNALKAQSYNNDNSETANRAETPTYISKIAVAYGAKENTPKDILKNKGFTIIDKDLNAGCGSLTHYIYMGYKTTTNPADAITGIYIREGNDPPNSATFDGVTAYLLGGSTEDNPAENKPVDLNIDAGGATLHVYVSRNTNLAAITDIKFSNTNSMSGYVTQNVDLNKGASGEYIYLHYKQFSGNASATFHYLNSSGSRTSSTTSVSVKHHQQAVNNTPSAPTSVTYDGRTWTLLGWREDNNATTAGSNPSYTYMDSKVYRAVYSADVSLTYNANGGSNAPSKQTAKQYVNAGSSSIAESNTSFTIPSTTPTHDATKCNFAGWGTSSSSTTAQYQAGGSISINKNTTLYAVWPEHNGTQTYVNNGSNHTYTWSCCEKSVTEDHIYNNGIDNHCGAHIHEIDGNGYCHLCDGYPAELVNGYYEIYNADNLFWFAEYVNTIDRTASAKLMNDINLENRPWTPIGTTGETSHNFRGHFDGNGKTITGLNVTVTRNGGGFFGEVRLGTVEDFTIYGEVKLNGKHNYVGGVIGSAPGANSNKPDHNGATIRNITSYVNVTLGEGSHGSNHVAGFIGYANHETLIENCTWYGTLDLDAYRAQDGVGGLVGKANDNSEITIRNCAAYGTIKTSYQSGSYNSHNSIYIGGIVSNSVASAQTTLENCIWAGTLINNTNLGNDAHISAIGTLNGIKSVSNCYALNNMPYITTITTNNAHNNTGITITEVTAEQLASGEIAYKLQGTQATQIWGQNIDNGETADSKPILGGAKVYKHTFDGTTLYSNSQTLTAGGKCGDNLYWKVSDNTLTIFGTGAMYDYDNSSYKAPWRSLTTAPTSLVLKDGITHIGNYAFRDCYGFKGSLTIPNSVTSIGNYAFQNCSGFNGSLTIPNSVTTIGNYAFQNCSGFNGSLTIPNSVTSIGNYAFAYCDGFTGDLTIPNSVTSIGYSTFRNCSGFTGSLTIPNSVTTIGMYAFQYCEGFTGSLTISNSVTTIGIYAFFGCSSFTGSLTIGNSVTTIGDYAFCGCSGFSEVYSFAEVAPTLETYVFSDISSNATLYYPASSEQSYNNKGWFNYFSKRIGFNGKCGDNLFWRVDDENTLTIFGTGAMYDYNSNDTPWKNLNPAPTSLVLKEGITYLGKYAFQDCSGFTEVYSLAETAPVLGTDAFKNINENATLYYPASSEQSYKEKGWFNYFSKRIGFNGKCGDNLYWYVDDENALTIFGTGAMYDYDSDNNKAPWHRLNPAPTSLVLEEGITYIGNYAFQDCSSFTEVYSFAETAPTLGTNTFTGANSNAILYYPASSEQSYDKNGWFNYFPQHIGFDGKCGDNLYWHVDDENTLTIFGTGAMYDYNSYGSNISPWNNLGTAPTSLVLEEGITTIGDNAFYNCFKFTGSLTIPNSVTTIGNYAFQDCSGFTGSLTIGNSVTSIGDFAFYSCEGFNEVHSLAETVPTLGNDAFSYINKNATLYYPASSEQSYEEEGWFGYFSKHFGFGKCGENLYWSVDDKNALTIFGTGAMYDFDSNDTPWKNLNPAPTSLVLKEGITYIGKYAFYDCDALTEVYSYNETAPVLGTDAFANINENATLYYLASSEQSYKEEGWFNYFQQHIGLNGKCGENLYWYVNDENTLTIFGSGNMWDYDNSGNNISPWRKLETSPTSLVLKEGITHIGIYAFAYCSDFTGSLTIPNSVTNIGNSAFQSCSGFTGSLTIPNSVTCIRHATFYNCSGFNGSLTIPNSVNDIEQVAFSGCSGFTGTLTIGNSVTTIKDYAFYQCSGFTGSLTIPNSVTYIGNEAFYNCSGFTDIFFYRDANPTIATSAFSYINANAKVYAPVIWESFSNIPEDKLVKMATYVGLKTNDEGQKLSTTGWVFPEGMTEVGENDHVAINAPLVLGSQQDYKTTRLQAEDDGGQQSVANSLSVKSFGLCGNGTTVNVSITIEDGAQLYCEIANGEVTVKKEILGYQQSESESESGSRSESRSESESKWYTIASPLKDAIQITHNSTLLTPNSDYDLYRYDEPTFTWENYKYVQNNFTALESGRGYLYANAKNTTLEFTGMINTDDVTYNLTTDGDKLNGFHLVGNPFTHNITFAHLNATEGASLVNGYYVLNGEGAWGATLGSNGNDVIKVGQGVLVKAKSEGALVISRQPSAVSRQRSGKGQQDNMTTRQQALKITVSNAKYSDRAFVVFDKGVGLDKMNHENEDIPLLYIPMEDADYAIAMMDINANEIPVNFETNVMGQYTISLRQENCEFSELYLLDKETNTTVNILAEDYTFIATSNDSPERFVLLMKANGQQATDSCHFAYVNNNDIVIYDIEGDADIRIFDALGRCVYQGESSDETTRISNGYSAGVYMIHKIDDNGVNVQKIIL